MPRAVFYAVNGLGAGHLTRLVAAARWLRFYGALVERPVEAWFLTTSEATGILWEHGMAAFKIPSKSIVSRAGIAPHAHKALAKQWVWHTLGLLRPDLFVVDTFPRGAFGELVPALDLAKHTAFVHRPVLREVSTRPEFAAMLPLYDRLFVPEATLAPAALPEKVVDRATATGLVTIRERGELFAREEARARLGIPKDAEAVLVTLGGGGDPDARAALGPLAEALSRKRTRHVAVFGGPLHTGERRTPPRTSFHTEPDLARHLLAFDAAVAAAGYNTHAELLMAGVPSVFLPFARAADDQAARAAASRDAGACLVASRDPEDVAAKVDEALRRREELAEAARARFGKSGARALGRGLAALLYAEEALRRADRALPDAFVDEFGAWLPELATVLGTLGAPTRAEAALEALETVPPALRPRFAAAAVKTTKGPSSAVRVKRLVEWIDALAPLGDWDGAERALAAMAAGGRAPTPRVVAARVKAGVSAFELARG